MTFQADYSGAIVVEAANYGYGVPNRPKTWGFHTPEEPADAYPSTPDYLATTDRDASYTYFVSSWLALVFQLVPESEGAYAHGLEGKPEPSWSDGSNLNLQTLSLSFEGHAATIHQTMLRGCPQWVAGVNLVAHRTKALGLNLDWVFQHKQVSIYRGDCGQFDQAAFIDDVKAKMQEDDMGMTPEERAEMDALKVWQWAHATLLRDASTTAAFLIEGRTHRPISPDVWEAMERDPAEVVQVPHDYIITRAPYRGPDVTLEEARGEITSAPAAPTLREIAAGLKIEVK